MEIQIKAFLVHSDTDIEEFNAEVTELKAPLIKANQEWQYNKIVNILKTLKEQGVIKSIFIPKNKKIQKYLDKLTMTKRQLKNSISKIKQVYT